jgi:exopolyphosphatase/pppGpp-phosphohydrolase
VKTSTSGTARAIARLAQELAGPVHADDGIRAEAIARLVVILTKLKPSGLLSLGVEAGRTDTIAVGAVIMQTLVELIGLPIVQVSERALREGVAVREQARLRGAAQRFAIQQPG